MCWVVLQRQFLINLIFSNKQRSQDQRSASLKKYRNYFSSEETDPIEKHVWEVAKLSFQISF